MARAIFVATTIALLPHRTTALGFLKKDGTDEGDANHIGDEGGLMEPLQSRFRETPVPEEIFKHHDQNDDGKLTTEELGSLLKSLGFSNEELDQMRAEMDRNLDSSISFQEFHKYLSVPVGQEELLGGVKSAVPQAQYALQGQTQQYQTQYQPQYQAQQQPRYQPRSQSQYQPQYQPQYEQLYQPQGQYLSQIQYQPQVGWRQPADALQTSPDPPAEHAAGVFSGTTTRPTVIQAPPAAAGGAGAPPTATGSPTAIAPFGKEDTAQELQAHAAKTQDTLIDAVENAEVAEIKRAVFRALTRLRAAQIKEFDTIARLETQAIDEYNDNHHFRAENPLGYLAENEPAVQSDKYSSFH